MGKRGKKRECGGKVGKTQEWELECRCSGVDLAEIAVRPGAGEGVGETLLDGPAGTAAPDLVERVLDGGEEVRRIGRADLLRVPVVAERLADRLERRGAGPLADLLGEELRQLGARGADVDRVPLALDKA